MPPTARNKLPVRRLPVRRVQRIGPVEDVEARAEDVETPVSVRGGARVRGGGLAGARAGVRGPVRRGGARVRGGHVRIRGVGAGTRSVDDEDEAEAVDGTGAEDRANKADYGAHDRPEDRAKDGAHDMAEDGAHDRANKAVGDDGGYVRDDGGGVSDDGGEVGDDAGGVGDDGGEVGDDGGEVGDDGGDGCDDNLDIGDDNLGEGVTALVRGNELNEDEVADENAFGVTEAVCDIEELVEQFGTTARDDEGETDADSGDDIWDDDRIPDPLSSDSSRKTTRGVREGGDKMMIHMS